MSYRVKMKFVSHFSDVHNSVDNVYRFVRSVVGTRAPIQLSPADRRASVYKMITKVKGRRRTEQLVRLLVRAFAEVLVSLTVVVSRDDGGTSRWTMRGGDAASYNGISATADSFADFMQQIPTSSRSRSSLRGTIFF